MNNLKIKEINNSKVDPIYTSVYIIKNNFKIYKNNIKEDDTFYTIIGINLDNKKHILYMTHHKENIQRMWLDVFEILKKRGINEILFLTALEDKNIKKALRISYPNAKFTPSIIELADIFFKYTSERSNKDVYCKIKSLYTAETIDKYKNEEIEFDNIFNNFIQIKLKEKYLKNVEAIYNHPYNIRRLIYSGYKNLEYYNNLRLYFNNKVFTNLDDLYTELENSFVDDFNINVFSKNDWTSILSEIMVQYPEINVI